MPRAFSLAGFEVTLIGRFWVTTEAKGSLQRKTLATRLSQPIFAPGVFAIVADPKRQSRRDARLSDYTSSSTLTSFADDVVTLLNMAVLLQKTVSVRYPRDLGMRDLDH